MRRKTIRQKPRKSKLASYPAPTGGLISNRNLAISKAPDLPPGAAVLEDFFPTATGIVLRRGMERYASIVANNVVRSIIPYIAGTSRRLFAAVDTGIRDITSVVDPLAFSGPDVLTGQTNGDWNVVQFATIGGTYLVGVNGHDPAFLYDGTTFGAAAITFPVGAGLTTADLSYVWVYKQRIWFIQKDSMDAWYLPVDQVAGELTKLPLGGVFVRGGSLTWGQAWSLDSGGQGGLSEQCVFVSTEGEVAAYQGLSPEPGQGWSKVGQYRIGRPMGQRAFMRAGGDIVVATTVGFISMASASRNDYAALGENAVSYPIEDDWASAVAQNGQTDWRVKAWPDRQMVLIAPPPIAGRVPKIFAANLNTGRWCKFNNWDVRSLGLFQGRMFFGASDGTVKEAWVTGSDEGQAYVGISLPLFDDLGAPGSLKVAKMARAVTRSSTAPGSQLSGHSNFVPNFPAPPSPGVQPGGDIWGVGLWGGADWAANTPEVVTGDWVPVGAYGHDISVGIQVASAQITPKDVELIRIDVTYVDGDVGT